VARPNTGRSVGRPKGSLTGARGDLSMLSQLQRGQVRFWRLRQRQMQRKLAALDENDEVPAAMLEEAQRIDAFLAKATAGVVTIREAIDTEMTALPTEQLEAQLAAELVAASKTWTSKQWRLVISQAPDEVLEARMS
jgi:hypothetical protein